MQCKYLLPISRVTCNITRVMRKYTMYNSLMFNTLLLLNLMSVFVISINLLKCINTMLNCINTMYILL